jgi:hypothetical protein
MPIEYDPNTSEFRYEGNIVGRYDYNDGIARVSLNLTYECDADEWVVPLSWFAYGLSLLEKHKPHERIVSLTIQTEELDIAEEYKVPRMLMEVIIKRNGYVWRFHKKDDDQWPSALHAHDNEKNLKLDALTGNIYDVATRHCCKKLSTKALKTVQDQLRGSKDFAARAAELLTE